MQFSCCIIVFLFSVAGCISAPRTIDATNIGSDLLLIGSLGKPIGQEVVIRGHHQIKGPPTNRFLVEEIDGKPARPETVVLISGIEKWPEASSVTLRGIEQGTIRYLHLAETNYGGPGAGGWTGSHQTVFIEFIPSEVLSPANLRIEPTKR